MFWIPYVPCRPCGRIAQFWRRAGLGIAATLIFGALSAGSATAQSVPIGPFVGNRAETWEEFPNFLEGGFHLLPDPTSILEGDALLANTDLTIYEPFVADASLGLSGFAQTADGTKGLLVGDLDPNATLTLTGPVTDFGAYWGAETFGGLSSVVLNFYNANNGLIATASFDYNHEDTGDGALDWHGWHFAVPVQSLTFTGSNVALDGIQANAVPEGNFALLPAAFLAALCVCRRRHRAG
jgi:hypothetical protein